MGLSSREVVGADNSLNLSQAGVLDNISKTAVAETPQPALKCPRCDSRNTKFCYYNNYSRMQPRHLCRACKRHWTAGGTLRNVPVGGGRKNKRARTRDDAVKLDGQPPGQQLPIFNLDYESNIFPDVLSQVISLPQLLPPTPLLLPSDYGSIESPVSLYGEGQGLGLGLGREENYVVHLNKSVQELPELSLSYWNCWDGGLTELGVQDSEGMH